MSGNHLLQKDVKEAMSELDIFHAGYLYYLERPSRSRRPNLLNQRTIPLDRIMSDNNDPEAAMLSQKDARPTRPVRRQLEKFIIRDYGVLEVQSLQSSLQLRKAAITNNEASFVFEITERTDSRAGSACTVVVEARDKHEYKAWAIAFREIQYLEELPSFSAYPRPMIAEGCNGRVFYGKADRDKSPIVVKIISRVAAPVPALVESFVARRLMIIRPENYPKSLVACRQVFHTPRETHVVMEHVAGPSLHDWLQKNGPMGDAEAHRVFVQVLEAVRYLHSLGILHGGITTRNVLICDPSPEFVDRVKLIDFSATSMKTDVSSELFYPTRLLFEYKRCLRNNGLEYIAPELWGDPHPSPSLPSKTPHPPPHPANLLTDFWGLGCLLYGMLVGRLPFANGLCDPWNDNKSEHGMGKMQEYACIERVDLLQEALFPKHCPLIARLTPDARSILFQLLRPDRTRRLGPRSIGRHPWIALSRSPPSHVGPGPFWPERLFR